MRTPPSSREARRCQHHCSGCGSHFTSLEAFDDHRVGDFAAGKVCWGEGSEDRLEIVREDGICDIGHSPPRIAVRLWRHHPGYRAEASVSPYFPASDVPDDLDPDLAA